MSLATTPSTITDHEAAQVDRASATKATPVVFVHGLWLLPGAIIRRLDRKPVVIGNSFGGHLAIAIRKILDFVKRTT